MDFLGLLKDVFKMVAMTELIAGHDSTSVIEDVEESLEELFEDQTN